MDHWVWQDRPVSKGQAWVDLIMLANYKSKKFSYKDSIIEGKRGTVYRSISYLAERWGWSRDKATRFLRQLEADGMVQMNATTHQTTISIVNYEVFQGVGSTGAISNRRQTNSKQAANRQQAATYNKVDQDNNSKHVNNVSGVLASSEQTQEEIEEANRWFESL